MSKRFGRNQKRKMQAQLSNTQSALEMEKLIHNHTAGERDKARRQVRLCAEVLGNKFIGFDPEVMHIDQFIDRLYIPAIEWFGSLFEPDFRYNAALDRKIELKPLYVDVQKRDDLGDVGYQVACYLPNGNWRLFVSENALKNLSRQSAEHFVLNAIGRDLVRKVVELSHGRKK